MPFLPTGLLAGCTPPPELGSGWFLVDDCSIYLSTARSHLLPRLDSGLAPPPWHLPRFPQDAVNPPPWSASLWCLSNGLALYVCFVLIRSAVLDRKLLEVEPPQGRFKK